MANPVYFVEEVFSDAHIAAIVEHIRYDAEAELFYVDAFPCPVCHDPGLQVLNDATSIPGGDFAVGDDETLRIVCRCQRLHPLRSDPEMVHGWCGRSVAGVEIPDGL